MTWRYFWFKLIFSKQVLTSDFSFTLKSLYKKEKTTNNQQAKTNDKYIFEDIIYMINGIGFV